MLGVCGYRYASAVHPCPDVKAQPSSPSSMKSPLTASGICEFPTLQTLASCSALQPEYKRFPICHLIFPASLMGSIVSPPL